MAETKDDKDDKDKKAESLCRWGAARAGVIILIPGIGLLTLIANEMYMIIKMGSIYGLKLSSSAVRGFILGVGGRFVQKTLWLVIPIAHIQIPLAITVTYGVGRAARVWIKDGMPENIEKYKKIAENAAGTAKDNLAEIQNDKRKNQPLGEGA